MTMLEESVELIICYAVTLTCGRGLFYGFLGGHIWRPHVLSARLRVTCDQALPFLQIIFFFAGGEGEGGLIAG